MENLRVVELHILVGRLVAELSRRYGPNGYADFDFAAMHPLELKHIRDEMYRLMPDARFMALGTTLVSPKLR